MTLVPSVHNYFDWNEWLGQEHVHLDLNELAWIEKMNVKAKPGVYICDTIKQNELDVGSNMLLVSGVLFHSSICKYQCQNQQLVARKCLMLHRSSKLCKPSYSGVPQVCGFKFY